MLNVSLIAELATKHLGKVYYFYKYKLNNFICVEDFTFGSGINATI